MSLSPSPLGLTLTPPQAALLDCLHIDAERPRADSLRLLTPADWKTFERLATTSKVAFQVYRCIKRADLAPLVPAEQLARLKARTQAQTTRYLRLRATLIELLRACNAHRVPVMVLKGAHLAEQFYQPPAAREMSDIDLLFKPEDLPQATRIFKALGYRIAHEAQDVRELAPDRKEHTLRHPRWGVGVDVHWAVFDDRTRAGPLECELWRRADRLTIAGSSAWTMSREDLLLYLCYHASHQHHFSFVGLRPLIDLAALCSVRPSLDWAAVSERAAAWRWQRGVHLSLALASECLGAEVSTETLQRLRCRDAGAHVPYAAALEAMLVEPSNARDAPDTLRRIWRAPTLTRRLSIALERLFPPRSQLIIEFGLSDRQRLPPQLWLHLRRIGRLIPRYGTRALAIARRDPRSLGALRRRQQLVTWLSPHGEA